MLPIGSPLKQHIISKNTTRVYCVVMDWSSVNDIDSTAIRVLKDIIKELRQSKILLLLADVKGAIRDQLRRVDLDSDIGLDHVFWDLHTAVEYGRSAIEENEEAAHSAYASSVYYPMMFDTMSKGYAKMPAIGYGATRSASPHTQGGLL